MSMSTSSTTESQTPNGLLHVGRVGRPHGVKGEMYVDLFSAHPQRVATGARWQIADNWYVVSRCRPQGQRWLVSFDELDDRNVAERLTNRDIFAEPIDDPDVVWVHQLVGRNVRDVAGVVYGRCVAVIDNPAHPIMELDNGALVPTPFIVEYDDDAVTIDAPEGLFDDAD
jgi:16S rRNA processing protein RimM